MGVLDRVVLVPPEFAARSCVLVHYRLPFLRHCYVLCHDPPSLDTIRPDTELLLFFLDQARHLAQAAVGDPEALMIAYSGSSVRRRSNLHMHVFIVRSRPEKAWVYTVLAAKNVAVAVHQLLRGSRVQGRRDDDTNTAG